MAKKLVKEMITHDATNPQDWMKGTCVPNELKDQIAKMSPKDREKAFTKKQLAFGTAGIRGKMGPGTAYLNKFVYQQMMVGYCEYILSTKVENPSIVIGHDNRLHSASFALECANIAIMKGIKVYLFEDNKLMPTPIISYVIRKFKCTGGINITASHNPKEDNGFKAYNALGCQILPDEAKIIVDNMPNSKDILDIIRSMRAVKNYAQIVFINYDRIVDEYFDKVIKQTVINKEFLKKDILIKKQPIVFTGFHGTTTELMPKFLKKLGFKHVYVYPGHATISGKFENAPISNPENPKAFDKVIQFANQKKATIIFGCDPDGDRMSVGFKKTNRWRFLNGNEMGIIYTHYILKRKEYEKKPYILSTHLSTNYIDRIAKRYNASVIRTKTGFKWMCNLIDKFEHEGRLVVAFEEAIGALTHTVCRDKDSFGAVCLTLEIYHTVSDYFVDLHDYIQTRIFNQYGPTFAATYSYTIKSEKWMADAKMLMKRALDFKPCKIYDYVIKSVRYDKFADAVVWELNRDSFIKFRISGTEPKFKVYLIFNDQLVGQLKAAAKRNLETIEKKILKGVEYTK